MHIEKSPADELKYILLYVTIKKNHKIKNHCRRSYWVIAYESSCSLVKLILHNYIYLIINIFPKSYNRRVTLFIFGTPRGFALQSVECLNPDRVGFNSQLRTPFSLSLTEHVGERTFFRALKRVISM